MQRQRLLRTQIFLRSFCPRIYLIQSKLSALKAAETGALAELKKPTEEQQQVHSEKHQNQDDQLPRFFAPPKCPPR